MTNLLLQVVIEQEGPDPRLLIDIPWIVFLIYWIIAAFKVRVVRKREAAASRYGVMLVLVCGYFPIFSPRARIGVLGRRFVPATPAVMASGVILTWLGVVIAIWARRHLARNWSARVTIKVDHELIRTGPYARMRHPIYSGLLLATLGTAVAVGDWRALLGVGLVLAAYSFKAKKEEAMLAGQFGGAFAEHRQRTGFLLPRWR